MLNALYSPLSSLFVGAKSRVVLQVLLLALLFVLVLAFFIVCATSHHLPILDEGPWPHQPIG